MFGRAFWVTAIAAIATMSFAGTAMTNSGTLPSSTNSSYSTGAIGEFTATGVAYNLNTTDPRKVDSITFTLGTSGTTPTFVKVRPVSSTTNWYTCSLSGSAPSFTATCNTTSPQWTLVSSLTNMTSLSIVVRD